MRFSWLLTLLLSTTCLADGIMPSINDTPALWGILGNDPKYHDAAFKAQEAMFLQLGIASRYSLFTGYVSNKVTILGQAVEGKTAYFIDNNTPFNSKHIFLIAAIGYGITARKEITQKFRDPFFNNVNHSVILSQDAQVFGTQISF